MIHAGSRECEARSGMMSGGAHRCRGDAGCCGFKTFGRVRQVLSVLPPSVAGRHVAGSEARRVVLRPGQRTESVAVSGMLCILASYCQGDVCAAHSSASPPFSRECCASVSATSHDASVAALTSRPRLQIRLHDACR